jgi:hypothetical protein
MTDRISALTVVLNQDIRSDDVEVITNAIRMIRGVASVDLNVVEPREHIARERVRSDIESKLRTAVTTICRGELPDWLDEEKHRLT